MDVILRFVMCDKDIFFNGISYCLILIIFFCINVRLIKLF